MKVAILCHQQLEQCECLIAHDLFKRVGYRVQLLSIENTLQINSSLNLQFICDDYLQENSDFDILYIPGGPGIKQAIHNEKLLNCILRAHKQHKLIAAICAAPDILAKLNIVQEEEFSCYPGCDNHKKASTKRITTSDTIFTAQALGSCYELCFAIIEKCSGIDRLNKLKQQIHF